ncbi:hypothetical protein FDB55_05030 [Clostridium botulinum]|uniref:Uncharacterized protein n=1 Tax=Clostridium botulinum TaxID=1491 RepID=A0A0C2NV82_CLOBO|nr:hypothetical protein [Clostridium botulinum]ACD51925.1 hypothetical protein CLH_0276 [Clostridium botulinum E3 str. Alaska E43]AJF28368.1 hypothetical protein ST13_01285 [Clostridium botulinum]AJF31428.1 hypothetical protein ST12_01285 [Clostridium botulinum]KAI3348096.1 hypothetical protein CIT18_11640 [Clostridium botulinum]KIL08579.1 hypothetical protein SR42_06160 [Clostridium botulinum]
MNNINLNKIIRNVTYILIIFLIVLILYNCILLLNNSPFNKTSYKNSLRVENVIEYDVYDAFNINSSYKIKFKEDDISKLPSLSKAEILMLNYDPITSKPNYSAIFFNNDFITDSSMEIISYIDETDFPNITFLEYEKLKNEFNNNYIDTISIINIDFSFSNFLYYNNEYHHFNNGIQSIDPSAKLPITYKNIVIDTSSKKENTLYVYSGGLFKEFKKDSSIYLTKGKTFWMTLNDDSKITYTFSDVENKLKKQNN